MCNLKWKDRFLSSGLPLEVEAAKILIDHSFYVDMEYSYQRLENDIEKELSVDINAGGHYPFNSKDFITNIDILVECKYRNENKRWLFV